MRTVIIRSSRKSISASVKDGVLTVRAPLFTTDADIARFLEKHRAGIDRLVKKAEEREKEKVSVRKLTPDAARDRGGEAARRRAT